MGRAGGCPPFSLPLFLSSHRLFFVVALMIGPKGGGVVSPAAGKR